LGAQASPEGDGMTDELIRFIMLVAVVAVLAAWLWSMGVALR
jgi:hypothetical protein